LTISIRDNTEIKSIKKILIIKNILTHINSDLPFQTIQYNKYCVNTYGKKKSNNNNKAMEDIHTKRE
ncbi:MAG: hypothetical protein Q4Q22_05765, partial [Methanosphaera sp.]|nr:hypothetical protein [Methanosphaera sp.]